MENAAFFSVVMIIMAAGIVVSIIRAKCPRCGRRFGMRRTGMEQVEGFFVRRRNAEYQCIQCGHTEWRRKRSRDSD